MNLPSDYQEFIHKSRYARWLEDKRRRETWTETVTRYMDFMQDHLKNNYNYNLNGDLYEELFNAIINLEVMPSMRCLMTAGPALERDNICGYNCSYLPVDSLRAFDEALYILMCGTGVGYSVERRYIDKLPKVADEFISVGNVIQVADSKQGWAEAFKALIKLLHYGAIPKWDLSKLRPAGARLKTFGGRSSGSEPLNQLFHFTVELFKQASGRQLTSLECHDLMCKIGEAIVSGGVRRSAMLSLSNLSDERMRHAKDGQWFDYHPHRSLANNSICYTEKPDIGAFMREWITLYESRSGERGIYNRTSASSQAERNGRRDGAYEFGTNPCSEIILRPNQFCNLTEVIVRAEETYETLREKVRKATILGTFQATLTNFKYLRKIWTDNTEEERLLGVSLTGIMDQSLLSKDLLYPNSLADILSALKQEAIGTNADFALQLGINQATAVTCVKPSGTVSQLTNTASGIHPRFSEYYIRTVRCDKKDPFTQFMIDQGIPHEDDVTNPSNISVFSFPIHSPSNAVTVKDISAIEQLSLWKIYQEHWCEHKPSITIYIKPNEWMEVGTWVWNNFDLLSGISFLPYSEHDYQQAPYQQITEIEYEEAIKKMPQSINWDTLSEYESEDNTIASQELACVAGSCEI